MRRPSIINPRSGLSGGIARSNPSKRVTATVPTTAMHRWVSRSSVVVGIGTRPRIRPSHSTAAVVVAESGCRVWLKPKPVPKVERVGSPTGRSTTDGDPTEGSVRGSGGYGRTVGLKRNHWFLLHGYLTVIASTAPGIVAGMKICL